MTMATNPSSATSNQPQQQQLQQQQHQPQQPPNDTKQSNEESLSDSMAAIDSDLFNALQNVDLDQLHGRDLTRVLPFLTNLLLNPSFIKRQQLLKLLYPIRKMNDMIQMMASRNNDNCEPTSCFEASNCLNRLKIVASEYLRIQDLARQSSFNPTPSSKFLQSDLFDNLIYVDDVSYCLCIILLKSSTNSVINILDMCEALLHVKFGSTYIIRLVANMPDRCQEVCHSLVTFGERQDEGASFNDISEQRAKTLRRLCLMSPSIAFTVRSTTLQLCKMPSVTIMITIDHLNEALERYESIVNPTLTDDAESCDKMDISDPKELSSALKKLEDTYDSAIAFITGILLGVDENTRSWFAQFTKSAQLKRTDQSHFTVLSQFRSQILVYIDRLFPSLLEDNCPTEQSDDDLNPDKISSSMKDKNKKLIRATATLRLYCALRGIGTLKLNPEESEILLRLITCKPVVNQTSVNFATTGVCTLLACSALINNQKEERKAADWLKWLIKESNYSDNRYSSHGKCSISELLLLIAIHFQNNQNNQIAELVCATLNMKLQVKTSVSKCKSLFVQEVFNDQMVAEHAVRVPVTRGLSDSITEFLPVHCIHQLLESRSFSKHQVPIKDWIYEQICESKKPIHHIMPKLIEAYVNSVIISTSAHGHCGTNQPIPEEDIARIFRTHLYSNEKDSDYQEAPSSIGPKGGKKRAKRAKPASDNEVDHVCIKNSGPKVVDVEAAQVLLLYYLVLYEDVRLRKNADLSTAERTKLIKYSPDFMMEVPVFYLLRLVRENQNSFGTILPDLLKLVTSQYPQLCSIQHWLTVDHYAPNHSDPNQNSSDLQAKNSLDVHFTRLGPKVNSHQKSPKALKENLLRKLAKGFEGIETDPLSLAQTIISISILPREEIWRFVDLFIENLSKVLSLKVSASSEYTKVIQATTKLWWKFNTIFPRKLWVMTVNALKKPQNLRIALDVKSLEFSWDELALDPLIVLRCDSRVFRCVDTLNIVLHILNAFLAASRRLLQDQINEQPNRHKDVRNLEELRTTLVLAQTSAAIQILLESCIPTDDEQDALNKRCGGHELSQDELLLLSRFDASVNCICEHLHQVFIADTNLAKLVHFQTYPSELLATTSDKIPSMHICLDFIPELLSQPDITKQVFVIELASHLCDKYAITKSLNVAKLCFNVAYTLLQLLPSERRALFFIPVLPALLRICKVFPILQEDAEIILTQINQITLAHMASTSSRLSLGSTRPFEGLNKMSWREVKKLMNSLNLHEALYLSIQKCSMDLNQLKTNSNNSINQTQELYFMM